MSTFINTSPLRQHSIEMSHYQSIAVSSDLDCSGNIVHLMAKDDIEDKVERTNDEPIVNNPKRSSFAVVMSLLMIIIAALFLEYLQYEYQRKNEPFLGSPISRTIPYRTIVHPDPPTGLWGTVAKPYPTGAFWTNLVVKNGDGPIGLYPYGIKTLETGIQISYGASRRSVTRLAISDSFLCDLQISTAQQYLSRSIEGYDNISVTMGYRTATNGRYRAHLVKSSPFVTVVFDNATPIISSPFSKIISVDAKVRWFVVNLLTPW